MARDCPLNGPTSGSGDKSTNITLKSTRNNCGNHGYTMGNQSSNGNTNANTLEGISG